MKIERKMLNAEMVSVNFWLKKNDFKFIEMLCRFINCFEISIKFHLIELNFELVSAYPVNAICNIKK